MSSKKNKPKRRKTARSQATSPAKPGKTAAKQPEPGFQFPMQRLPLIILFFLITFGGASIVLMMGGKSDIEELGYEVVASYEHDADAFTQGLYYDGSVLYESTGNPANLYEKFTSSIRKCELKTGKVTQMKELDEQYFGEGLVKVGDRLIQLTYKSKVAFVYDLDLNKVGEYPLDFDEGWGLAYDGEHLIASDGPAELRFLDPETFDVVKKLTVRTGKRRLIQINELEFVGNKLYANVWKDDSIYIINPKSGQVESRVNLAGILPYSERRNNDAVLNGIAFNPNTGNLLVTGKLWPKLFEIKLVEQ